MKSLSQSRRLVAALRAASFGAAALLATPAMAGEKPVVEVAFVLDTTGSMDGLIEGAKKKIWSIATTIADAHPDADIRMALVAYRDIGDAYVTRTTALSTDIQDMYGELLAYRAEGGGDWPESVNEAMDVAVRKLEWGQGRRDTRIIFLVGDAPPHTDYPQDRPMKAIIAEARSRGIIVNAVQAGVAEDTTRIWRSIAQLGHGEFIAIPQDGGQVRLIETPFDEEILKLQLEIDATVIPYGRKEAQEKTRLKLEARKAAPAPSSADSSAYIVKKSKGKDAITGSGDLVSDVEQGRIRLDGVAEAELPDDLRKLDAKERSAIIKDRAERRSRLSASMATLIGKRDAYIASETAKAPREADSFDRRVEETLKAQIQR
jgi:hypothetical protein